MFGRNVLPPSAGSKTKPSKHVALLAACKNTANTKQVAGLTFNGLHGVISQKIELFITTAVRTSKPI
jgi:hypothetical protein